MKIRNRIKELRMVKASELIPNAKNWRTHPQEQADALKGILAEVGYVDGIIAREVDGELHIVDGHLRAETTPDTEVPVLITDLDDSEAAKVLATFDPLGAMAGTNAEALEALLRDVDTGSEAVQQMLSELAEQNGVIPSDDKLDVVEDDVPEPPEDPVTQYGDLWILGEHRLLCGDSTKAEDVIRLCVDTPFVMVTDPPYGVNLNLSWRDVPSNSMGPGNPNVVANDSIADWSDAWRLFGGDVAYVWHAGKFSDVVMASLRIAGFNICQQLIWNKSIMVIGRSDYQFKHEPCWYAVRKGKRHGWIGDRKQTTVIDAKSPNHIMAGSDEDKTDHPTQKPVACMGYLMRNHAGIVYDPFLGSGTTLIAAEQLNRKCYGMEISPQYCDVIVNRWEALTGEKAFRE